MFPSAKCLATVSHPIFGFLPHFTVTPYAHSLSGASLQLLPYLGYYYSGSVIICALSRTLLRPLCFLPSLSVPVSHLAIPHPTPSHRNVVGRMVQLASWSATPRPSSGLAAVIINSFFPGSGTSLGAREQLPFHLAALGILSHIYLPQINPPMTSSQIDHSYNHFP